MRLPRRTLLAASALAATAPTAWAQGTDPRLAERGIGRPDAPVKVVEFFSLTCSHCAAFHRDTFPRVKKDLVETGAVRLIWRDFPLDQVALTAAAVARTLPADRYEGFISALLGSQDRWAFTRGDPFAELAKMAALAGMPKPQFDQVQADEALKRAILAERSIAEKEFSVQATPSFSFQGRRTVNQSGAMGFEKFAQLVQDVKPA
ncbi:thioredoxin domain-containing protein [Paracraurococcus ruber]|uniref:Disulfide bond formation protein DsbA n=1 Tax=Paracraurococcus ruber TaxID=77675 RepID=A0ABS1D4J5_9PROT|nr:thioredoxin domain-containing protein [Paracraurococcus ruber]MBK1661471.1 disulfide bond formation protein DsbA [Paracraurococcus ruber]TDG21326.1 DsbA family protein [Paracraurococcus ruber]